MKSIKTVWSIVFTNDNDEKSQRIEHLDKLKLIMKNGEILLGNFDFSDESVLYLNRKGGDLEIFFDEIKQIILSY